MLDENDALVEELASLLLARGMRCATAESCTGGLAGAMLTARPGSSDWYLGGVISYANEVKKRLLGVREEDLATVGAVSEPVVRSMALGACTATGAEAAMSTSGVAGPGGGTKEKPVGTVWIGWALNGGTRAKVFRFTGSRDEVRVQAARQAVAGLVAWLKEEKA
ncbi:CinA family protein [uncultured Mailhella sp.]|uniref:CinA family protein n=1 Tax=uncultured Mailhella sp. TaxID=1981031 RepID=UPI0025DE1594|nr:CinA family protein [uncultured Mailhella sp.]